MNLPLRFSLRQIEVFCAIARLGSVRAAADEVALTQSAASQALARLEEILEQNLFDRRGRQLVLNENGRQLLPRAQGLLDDAMDLQDCLDRPLNLSLLLGASTTIANYMLPQRLAEFAARHPGAAVQMRIGNTAEMVSAVVAMSLDCALVEGQCAHPDLHVQAWGEDELAFIAPVGHALTQSVADAQQMAAAHWLLREAGSGTRTEVQAWLHEHVGAFELGMEIGGSEAIWRAVAAGLGVSCMSRVIVAEALQTGQLTEFKTFVPPPVRQLYLIHHRQRELTRAARVFLQLGT